MGKLVGVEAGCAQEAAKTLNNTKSMILCKRIYEILPAERKMCVSAVEGST